MGRTGGFLGCGIGISAVGCFSLAPMSDELLPADAVCVLHAMSSITPYSFHALFALEDEAAAFVRQKPPIGRFLAFRVPGGWTWQKLGEACSNVGADGKLPRGVRKWTGPRV